MWQQAEALVPDNLRVPAVSGSPLVDWVSAHDRAAQDEPTSTDAPQAGSPAWTMTYRDGSPVSGEDAHPAPFSAPAPPDHGPAQIVQLGGNHAVNAAVLVDANAPGATHIVLGDMHQTDAIIQVNVLVDSLAISQSGAAASLWLGHDQTANVASLVRHAWSPGPTGEPATGLAVSVDTLAGDFWSVKSVTQSNWLDSHNVAVETQTQAYSKIAIGGNVQMNLAEFQHWTAQYDMVVVLGDYHGFNLIRQTNILHHQADLAVSSSTSADAGPASQTIVAGGNSLTNVASIEHYGQTSLHPVGEGQARFAADLAAGASLGEDAWLSYAGTARGVLKGLVVQGDYYDVNIVSQTNVMASSAVGILTSDGPPVTQYVAAGLNVTSNEAHIHTSEAGSAFVGGQLYSDSMMLQANLVDSSTPLVKADPTALVSESIAFLGQSWSSPESNPMVQIHSNHDPNLHLHDLGSLMS